jgi:molybdate transport system substrate-binding protein
VHGCGRKVLSLLLVTSLFSFFPQSYASQKATLTVFAASSLADSFTNLGKTFEKAHPGTTVVFSFLASQTLAMQINAGAPVDVFVSASSKDMQSASSRVPIYKGFISNRMVLAVPVKNPLKISRIKDLNKPGIKWIQCVHEVPCGGAADASLEPKASGVIAKLMQGEVDAAIVYHTDVVKNRKALKEIVFTDRLASSTRYAIAIVADGKQKALARTFVDFLESPKTALYLRRSGFGVIS